MARKQGPLLDFLVDQERATGAFSPDQWSLLCREARAANLMSRVAGLLVHPDKTSALPQKIKVQVANAARVGDSSARSVRWEVQKIHNALSPAGVPFILLKGAAYELADLPPANGRLFVDVDIMVPRKDIQAAERSFFEGGWATTKFNRYDQKYYRKWMHEIPPLLHMKRRTALDVHHTIIPPTASLKPDVDKLWESAIALPDLPNAYILGPEDMVLHSATHLFHDGDLGGGLRDLVDLDALIRKFSGEPGFMEQLFNRAREMDLLRPLYYTLRYARKYLNTPVPDQMLSRCEVLAAPPMPVGYIMDALVDRAFYPEICMYRSPVSAFAKWLLYVRSHYLRMPLYLLLPHLLRKAIKPEVD